MTMRIALFITCFNDTIFPETGRAMVRLHGARFLPARGRAVGRPAAGLGGGGACTARVRAFGVPGQAAERRRCRRVLPAPRDLPPDLPLAAHATCRRCAAAA